MKYFSHLSILLISISAFSQGPWTKEKGSYYSQLSYTTIQNYSNLFGDPDYTTERKLTDNTFQFYGEYGFSDKLTLIVNLPLKLIKSGDLVVKENSSPATKAANETSLGNVEMGLKYNFYKKKWVLSGQFSLETSTGSFDTNSGIRTGYDAWSFTPLFLAGRSFDKFYLQTFVGGIFRTNGYSSNFKIGGELGTKILKKIWLIGFVDIVKSFENGDIVLPTSNDLTGLYVNDQEYGSYGLKVIGVLTEDFGITGGYGSAFFGNNVAKKIALTMGVYYTF